MQRTLYQTSDMEKYWGKIMLPVFFRIFQMSCKLLNLKAILTSTEKVKICYNFRELRPLATYGYTSSLPMPNSKGRTIIKSPGDSLSPEKP